MESSKFVKEISELSKIFPSFSSQWLSLELNQKEVLLEGMLDFYREKEKDEVVGKRVEEVYLEFLVLGTYLNSYLEMARKTKLSSILLLRLLSTAQKLFPGIRKRVQKYGTKALHLSFSQTALDEHIKRKDLDILIRWLSLIGEFQSQIRFLKIWKSYLSTIHESKAHSLLNIARLTALSFSGMVERVVESSRSSANETSIRSIGKEALTLATLRKRNELYLNLFIAAVYSKINPEKRELKALLSGK